MFECFFFVLALEPLGTFKSSPARLRNDKKIIFFYGVQVKGKKYLRVQVLTRKKIIQTLNPWTTEAQNIPCLQLSYNYATHLVQLRMVVFLAPLLVFKPPFWNHFLILSNHSGNRWVQSPYRTLPGCKGNHKQPCLQYQHQ